ncbi:hypothetical protein LTR94_025358, partial [Friedmanniomyces endolithicus]
MEKVPMTAGGYRALDDQLKQLKSVERPSVIAAISEAREHGDLSENAEYHAAKERQGWIEGQIAEIEDKISRAQVIDVSKLSGDQVKFGATVTVVDEDTEEEASYQIVGEHEADVKKGKISIASPIARALISKEVGDVVEVNTPGGVKAYEILKVEWKARGTAARPLSIWVVSDGRTGIQNQALGLAEAVARLTPAEIKIQTVRWRPAFDRWPSALKTPAMLAPGSFDPRAVTQWPDLWIATGRATLPLSAR